LMVMLGGAAAAQDRVHLKDGRIAQGRILNLATTLISMELQLPGVAGFAKREFRAFAGRGGGAGECR
jgi:hypothetical protein